MDKDKFRELLQTFEQLAVKPEHEAELDSDTQATAAVTPDPKDDPLLTAPSSCFSDTELKALLALVDASAKSLPDLEATHPILESDRFRPSERPSAASAQECGEELEVILRQQLHTASRLRFTASFVARLWLQLRHISNDKLSLRGTRDALAGIEADLVSLCSATLLEAAQLETQAMEQQQRLEAQPHLQLAPPVKSTWSTQTAACSSNSGDNDNGSSNDGDGGNDSYSATANQTPSWTEEVALGARIMEFASAWLAVSSDPWVLDTVTNGLRFTFAAEPELPKLTYPEYSADEKAAIEKIIRWDLGDKVIEEVAYNPDLFVSHMYTLRIAGKYKALMECRPINRFLDASSVAVDQTPSVRSLIKQDDWMTRICIKCAYLSVPIHPEHRRYLVFKYDGRYYQYRTLPFGISVASKVFTSLLQAALRPLCERGLRVTTHIDEICLIHESCSELVTLTKSLCRHLLDLGFLLNLPASDLMPQQSQRFIGFVFHSTSSTIQLPKDQIKKVRRAAHTARSSRITAKQLASLIGKIRSIMPAIGPELWRIQEIEKCLDNSVTTPESWDNKVELSPSALAEIGWLCDNILCQKDMPFAGAEQPLV